MSTLKLVMDEDRAVEISQGGAGLLLRYVYRPDTPQEEAPRPYAHPVCSLSGEVLTCFRPTDHPWHHALSFTLCQVSGHNFWGGASYRRDEGYQWRNDQGSQHHVAWTELSPQRLAHELDWRVGSDGEVLLRERRTLSIQIIDTSAWTLRWESVLENVAGRPLLLGNYFSGHGIVGSHYTGLQFRGARDLLDDHGDGRIGMFTTDDRSGEKAVHGVASDWLEWRAQKDTSLRRVTIRFSNRGDPVHWFVRRHNPLAALAFQYERDRVLAPGATLALDHELTFTDTK